MDQKRDSVTPRASPTPITNPLNVTCFNCGEVGHFASSCLTPNSPNSYTTLRINEIEQEIEASGDKANNEDTDSKSEN